jgi:hypothetical protein
VAEGGVRRPHMAGRRGRLASSMRMVSKLSESQPSATDVTQPVTDDSIRVRHLSHYQFSWVAQEPGQPGVFTLQLVLDQGAWEEVVTVSAEDAEVLQGLLRKSSDVAFDVGRRVLMFGTAPVGGN